MVAAVVAAAIAAGTGTGDIAAATVASGAGTGDIAAATAASGAGTGDIATAAGTAAAAARYADAAPDKGRIVTAHKRSLPNKNVGIFIPQHSMSERLDL